MPTSPIDVQDIIVTATILNQQLNLPLDVWYRQVYQQLGVGQRLTPQTAISHGVTVYYEGPPDPPNKPSLVNASINRLSKAINQIGAAIDALADDAIIFISDFEEITGAEMKARFAVLTSIKITERSYAPGYGGANHVSDFEINTTAEAAWALFGGGSTRLLILHEITHNSISAEVIRGKTWKMHVANNGTGQDYIRGNQFFDMQESMTNKLALRIARSIGIDVDRDYSNGYFGEDYPPGGIYQGSDL